MNNINELRDIFKQMSIYERNEMRQYFDELDKAERNISDGNELEPMVEGSKKTAVSNESNLSEVNNSGDNETVTILETGKNVAVVGDSKQLETNMSGDNETVTTLVAGMKVAVVGDSNRLERNMSGGNGTDVVCDFIGEYLKDRKYQIETAYESSMRGDPVTLVPKHHFANRTVARKWYDSLDLHTNSTHSLQLMYYSPLLHELGVFEELEAEVENAHNLLAVFGYKVEVNIDVEEE